MWMPTLPSSTSRTIHSSVAFGSAGSPTVRSHSP